MDIELDQMESQNSASCNPQSPLEAEDPSISDESDKSFNERFESLLPQIQEKWPEVARQTLEATRGSLDEMVRVITDHSEGFNFKIKSQLEEILYSASDKTKGITESLEPLEQQLEELLDELNSSLRPRIEDPVRKKPLLAIGLATGIGLVLGILLAGGKRN